MTGDELFALPIGSVVKEDYNDGRGASFYQKQEFDGWGDWMPISTEDDKSAFESLQAAGLLMAGTSQELAGYAGNSLSVVESTESQEAA